MTWGLLWNCCYYLTEEKKKTFSVVRAKAFIGRARESCELIGILRCLFCCEIFVIIWQEKKTTFSVVVREKTVIGRAHDSCELIGILNCEFVVKLLLLFDRRKKTFSVVREKAVIGRARKLCELIVEFWKLLVLLWNYCYHLTIAIFLCCEIVFFFSFELRKEKKSFLFFSCKKKQQVHNKTHDSKCK